MNIHSGKLYGVTHEIDGTPRILEPRTVKVSIGLPKGKAIHVYIDQAGKWVVLHGIGKDLKRERFSTRQEAQKRYRELKATAPDRQYPQRLPYFTFSHISPDGDFEPDWDAIESHGPVPSEIDIIFIRDDPFSASYQLWTATEKKCEGDGLNAMRINSMAETKEEKSLSDQAAKRGEKFFPIINGCWLRGCKYARQQNGKPAPCRPMGRLLFQLLNSPRLGGTAVFMTSGYRSISQIFSSIEIFKQTTGCGDPAKGFVAGIPLKMVLRPYKVVHEGRPATQYGVSLELRAESAQALKQTLIEHGVRYRLAGREYLKQLEGAIEAEAEIIKEPEEIPAAIAAEFDAEVDIDEPSPDPSAAGSEPEHGLEQEDPAADDGPAGALADAWDEEEALAQAPPSAAKRPASEPAQPPNPRASKAEIAKFYELCRSRGMTDRLIIDRIGLDGFEAIEEITKKALPGLMRWAESYRPGQKNLI